MLTDEEVSALVRTWNDHAGLTITADDIAQQAHHRRRRGVIGGVAVLVLVAAVAVAGTLIGKQGSRQVPSTSPSPASSADWYPAVPADLQALNQKCYADIASGTAIDGAGKTHRYVGPARPALVVRHGTDSILVYFSFASGSGLYSCTSGYQKGGLLSASPSPEYGVQFEQLASPGEMIDGGWVIGFVPADTVSGTVAGPGTPTEPISVNHGLFAAFRSRLPGRITVVANTPTKTYTYPYHVSPPPPVPVPTDPVALAAACYGRATEGGGSFAYHGPKAPALELQQSARRELVFYSFVPKSMIFLCSDGWSGTGVGNFAPDAYGIHLGDQNCVTGFVPADTVSGTITYHGDTEPISVNHGLFAASISHFDIADYTAIIVAETPTKIYTISGTKVTVKNR